MRPVQHTHSATTKEHRLGRPSHIERLVREHYAKSGLLDSILDAAESSGLNLAMLTPEALAPVDEFHTAGRQTTAMALARLRIAPHMRVLDAGCGIGGTARYLATERGCQVTGVDLTPEYIEVARALTDRLKLNDRCHFVAGSILDLPYADASFDGALNFHVAMNIDIRDRLYAELARVLRPGAFLCLFDVMKGPEPGMRYPVPWSETDRTSFLRTPGQTAQLLSQAGFKVSIEENLRAFSIAFFRTMFADRNRQSHRPALGLQLLTGANSAEKFSNYARALDAHQVEPVLMVAHRIA